MLTEFRTFFTGAKLFVLAGVAAAIFAAGGVAAWKAPVIGAAARISKVETDRDRWKAGYDDWRRYGLAEKGAFDDSERLRGLEAGVATRAAGAADLQCDARVAAARASASAINSIINREPAHDPQTHCPVRRLADPGGVREALKPGSGPGG